MAQVAPEFIFPMKPDASTSVVEGYGYMTAIQENTDGSEQRRLLRQFPVRTYEATYTAVDDQQASWLSAVAYGQQGKLWGVPLWQYACAVTVNVSVADATIFCDPTGCPFGIDEYAVLTSGGFQSPSNAEAHLVASVTAPTSLQLASVTLYAWPKTTPSYVIPLITARLSAPPALEFMESTIRRATFRWTSESARP